MYRCQHFLLQELVSKTVFEKYGSMAWLFFDERLLRFLDWLREELDVPITINDWLWDGLLDERGLRENTCDIVKAKTLRGVTYITGHVTGKAVDLNAEGMTAKEVNEWLIQNKDRLPLTIRIEKNLVTKTWTHIDLYIWGHEDFIILKPAA